MARIPKRKIKIRRGDTYTHLVTEYDSDGELDDLTGSTFLVQLRETPEATTTIATFTTELIDAANGEWQFSLTATETDALPAGLYFFDVQRTWPEATVHTRFQGEALVEDDISHA